MCWYGKLKDKHIADEDIKVFKVVRVLENKIMSIYLNDFKWKLGKNYTTTLGIMRYGRMDIININRGFHCYDPEMTCIKFELDMVKVCCEFKRLDSYSLSSSISNYKINLFIMECIIPKGTEFYKNGNGEIVAKSITPISISIATKYFNTNGKKE